MGAEEGGEIVFGALMPHAPVLVPEVGRDAAEVVRATVSAMREAGRRLAASAADTLVLVTPHGPVQRDAACLYRGRRLAGDFGAFRAPEVRLEVETDDGFDEALLEAADRAGLRLLTINPRHLDHGSLVPLYFLAQVGSLLPAVILTPPWETATGFQVGRLIARVARRLSRRLAVVASGDLSHRLTPDAPAGYSPDGATFDARLVDTLRTGDEAGILHFPPALAERAGQDVLPSLAVLLGALRRFRTVTEVLSYEGPFGVGYAVATWRVLGVREEPPPVRAARRALELHLRLGVDEPEAIAERLLEEDPGLAAKASGVFVSLKKAGRLRGCTGTIVPEHDTLAAEIAANAVSSATRDPRFPPVDPDELDELDMSVDILEPPEPVESLDELDPERYGIIVQKGARRGLLLPNLPEITEPERQYALACRKAGLYPYEPGIAVFRFRTTRHGEAG